MDPETLAAQCSALIDAMFQYDALVAEQVALEYLAFMAGGAPSVPLFDSRLEADSWAATCGVGDLVRYGIAISKRLETETLGTNARRALARATFGAMSHAERKRIYAEFPVP